MQKRSRAAVHSPRTETLLTQARSLLNAGDFRAAELACAAVLDHEPNNAEALHVLGLLYRQSGNLKQSIERLECAAGVAPNRADVIYELGNSYHLAGEHQKAVSCYRRVLKERPRAEAAHNNLGLAFQQQGLLPEAINCYRNALNIRSEFTDALNNLGTALLELGANAEALESFRRAINVDTRFSDAYYNMHSLLISAGDIAGAVAALEQAVAVRPNNYIARAHLGIWLDYQGFEQAAKEHFDFISQHAPQFHHELESWAYIKPKLATGSLLLANHFDSLRVAMNAARIPGLTLEFGVRYGLSINFAATLTEQAIHGFDSFQGLPEEWIGMRAGAYTTHGRQPAVADNVVLHEGWFSDTLPPFVAQHPEAVRFANIDCDIYSSAKTILDCLSDRIVSGTVLIFDEYICNPGWQQDEYKAFQEFIGRTGKHYRYLLFSPYSRQAAVLIE
jgi:tetratricopeptide (TPR) repeat protein